MFFVFPLKKPVIIQTTLQAMVSSQGLDRKQRCPFVKKPPVQEKSLVRIMDHESHHASLYMGWLLACWGWLVSHIHILYVAESKGFLPQSPFITAHLTSKKLSKGPRSPKHCTPIFIFHVFLVPLPAPISPTPGTCWGILYVQMSHKSKPEIFPPSHIPNFHPRHGKI